MRAKLSITLTFIVCVLWGRSAWEGRAAFQRAEATRAAGHLEAARLAYREAMLWRCPLCPWPEAARTQLSALGTPPFTGTPRWFGSPPRPWLAAVGALALIVAFGAAALWAARGRARPWAVVTILAAITTALAVGAA